MKASAEQLESDDRSPILVTGEAGTGVAALNVGGLMRFAIYTKL